MYPKRRKIPIDVSVWMDKDVNIRKVTASSGLMPDTTRYNVFLSRKFYADMLELSSERHRKVARAEHGKTTFLKKQYHKAETTMPGLLPYIYITHILIRLFSFSIYSFRYIEPHITDIDPDSSLKWMTNRDDQSKLLSNRDEQNKSPSCQSYTTRSFIKSESTYFQGKQSAQQQISLEKINRLSQPKGRQFDTKTKNHIRPNVVGSLTAQDIFGNIDDTYQKPFAINQLPTTTDDKRFRRLIHLFSEVHEREPSNVHQSVQSLIQSKESLQYKTKNTFEDVEEENDQEIIDDLSYTKTDMYLVDPCA